MSIANSPRRLFWKLASPFAWCANRMGWCSYKWVNVCAGARRPDLCDALWQYEWYGAPIPEMPDSVILCGIEYRTGASEGTVTFVEDFTKCRITFERDAIARDALWYVELSGYRLKTPAPHVDAAYRWVKAVFGGAHEWKEAA
jgi:hypothetical protein